MVLIECAETHRLEQRGPWWEMDIIAIVEMVDRDEVCDMYSEKMVDNRGRRVK